MHPIHELETDRAARQPSSSRSRRGPRRPRRALEAAFPRRHGRPHGHDPRQPRRRDPGPRQAHHEAADGGRAAHARMLGEDGVQPRRGPEALQQDLRHAPGREPAQALRALRQGPAGPALRGRQRGLRRRAHQLERLRRVEDAGALRALRRGLLRRAQSPGGRHQGSTRERNSQLHKGSFLGRFPLVSADFWTSDHLAERSRSVDAFF